MKKTILSFSTILILLACSSYVVANESKGGGFGGFSVGVMYIDMSPINNVMGPVGYSSIDNLFITIGGSGYSKIDNFVIGGGGFGAITKQSKGSLAGGTNVNVNISGGFGSFETGYRIIDTDNFSFYPLLGIGGGGISMEIIPQYQSPTFNDIIRDPRRITTLDISSFSLSIALAVEFKVKLSEKKVKHEIEGKGSSFTKAYFEVGGLLKIGYMFLANTKLSLDGIEVFDAPSFSPHVLYASFSLLFGGGGEKLEEAEKVNP